MDGSDFTLFVIDDEPDARASIAALASSLGQRCETFSSAEQYLERFDPLRPGCVILDLRLGGMDGLQLQERLASLENGPPVILVTGYANISTAVRAMRNGAVTVLEKPCDVDELANAIRAAMEQHQRTQATRQKHVGLRLRFDSLDSREREAMGLIVAGLPNKIIARELGLSQRTVNRIRASIFKKMGAESAVALVQMSGELWKAEPVGT